jgi:hypothetical protein
VSTRERKSEIIREHRCIFFCAYFIFYSIHYSTLINFNVFLSSSLFESVVGFIEISHKRKFPSFTYISFLISLTAERERERARATYKHTDSLSLRLCLCTAQTLTRALSLSLSGAEASGLSAFCFCWRSSGELLWESKWKKINETFSFFSSFSFLAV